MKVIDKIKDYYYYLVGIYGEDEKLVLDTRERQDNKSRETADCEVHCQIGNYVTEGVLIKNKFYFGKELDNIALKGKEAEKHDFYWYYEHHKELDRYTHIIPKNESKNAGFFHVNARIRRLPDKMTIELNCPILLYYPPYYLSQKSEKSYVKFPVLKELNGLSNVLMPQDAWLYIGEWLSERNTERETSPELNNIEKVESHGFDKKTSFRNMKRS